MVRFEPVRSAEPPSSSGSSAFSLVEHVLRRLARGDRLGLAVGFLDQPGNSLFKIGGQLAGNAAPELGRFGGMLEPNTS